MCVFVCMCLCVEEEVHVEHSIIGRLIKNYSIRITSSEIRFCAFLMVTKHS